jgi:hypothetical protein
MSQKENDDPYMKGRQSYKRNMGRCINPYSNKDPSYNEFERGWKQAMMLTPDCLVREHENQRLQDEAAAIEDVERKKQQAIKAYSNRKG